MLFAERLLDGKAPIIFGDGNQTRDFVYVSDVVDALIRSSVVPEAVGEAFNIGSGVETTINDLAKTIMDIMTELTARDFYTKPTYGAPRSADFRRARMDISKARKLLGHVPAIMLEEGLRKTLRWRLGLLQDNIH